MIRLLAGVTPALDTGTPSVDEAAESMESLERAAIDVLRHLAPDLAPLIVYADDLHWIDPETIGVVHQLVLGVPGLDDVVVIGTYRPDGLLSRSPLSALLNAVERRPDGLNIRLDRLSLDEVADFAAQALGDNVPYRAVKALHHRSGGNPFFLEELIASSGDAGATDLADLPLPWTVAELLRDAVLALSEDERAVIEAASVLGQRVPFDLLAGDRIERGGADRRPARARRRRPARRGRGRRVRLPACARRRDGECRTARARAAPDPRGSTRRVARGHRARRRGDLSPRGRGR